jgi:hypothetical protein
MVILAFGFLALFYGWFALFQKPVVFEGLPKTVQWQSRVCILPRTSAAAAAAVAAAAAAVAAAAYSRAAAAAEQQQQ